MNAGGTLHSKTETRGTRAHRYLLPAVIRWTGDLSRARPIKILDIGCGDGYIASELARRGHAVLGLDPAAERIRSARAMYPGVRFDVGSVYEENLPELLGFTPDCIVSLEVIEHLVSPSRLFEQAHRLLATGGALLVSTPYHGYLKNLAISMIGGWDRHWDVQREDGHIRFFSRKTLARMACRAGFSRPRFEGLGRIPGLWKSMLMVVDK